MVLLVWITWLLLVVVEAGLALYIPAEMDAAEVELVDSVQALLLL
jgi:hypothetical protein